MSQSPLSYWRDNRASFLLGLKTFLRIPSISALPEHRDDVARAADFVATELRSMGMEAVTVMPPRHASEQPLIYAHWHNAPGKPTLLIYAHFDVQPVDPVALWKSPPFDPQERDGKLWARGSSDDKGQLYILLKVLEGYFKTEGKLPINVVVLFEGEEESNGTHIARYVREHKHDTLACVDASLVLDSGMFAAGLPTITTGLRGLVCATVTCRGASHDLHSGQYGGIAPNATEELTRVVANLKTPGGRVRIPGFYDGVLKPTAAERASWKSLPFDEGRMCKEEIGCAALNGDTRFSPLHRLFARPTLEVNGIAGGFAGDGFKTVIAAEATAKISMRLVPGQNPDAVCEAFRRFVAKLTPPFVKTEVTDISGTPAMVVDTENPFIKAMAAAYEETFGKAAAYVRDGASIPIAGTMQEELQKPVVITGITLPDCNEHAPNESIDIDNFHRGIESVGGFFARLGQGMTSGQPDDSSCQAQRIPSAAPPPTVADEPAGQEEARIATRRIKPGSLKCQLFGVGQEYDWDCGAGGFMALAADLGPEELDDFRKKLGTNPENGTYYMNIVRFGRELKLEATVLKDMDRNQLCNVIDEGIPVMLSIQAYASDPAAYNDPNNNGSGHYVDAFGWEQEPVPDPKPEGWHCGDHFFFYFMDPSIKGMPGYLTWKELEQRWHENEADNGKPPEVYHRLGIIFRRSPDMPAIGSVARHIE
jgi:acetylornithine deacetylase/succinyl-diaminopimelate desuccinylase-like protein